MFKLGLVGLPNVGKTTFFNIVTKSFALAANYPFATIDPNFGVLNIYDAKLEVLSKFWNSKKITPPSIEIFDIAGLVKGSSEGVGLGNQFLSHIRRVDAICHVLRCFENNNIINTEETNDPLLEFEIIREELVLSDLQLIEKLLKGNKKRTEEQKKEFEFLSKLHLEFLKKEKKNKLKNLTSSEEKILNKFNFLSIKDFFVLLNKGTFPAEKLTNIENSFNYNKINYIVMDNIMDLEGKNDEKNKLFFLKLGNLIKEVLNLKTFYTSGEQESKGWLIKKDANAKKCSEIIHTNISDGFVRANIYNYSHLEKNELKKNSFFQNKNIIKVENASYIVKDGDVCYFSFTKSASVKKKR